jgi:ABC-type spermidine/putrescine transport system permease subunit I
MHIYMKLSIANKRQTTDTINQILTQKLLVLLLCNSLNIATIVTIETNLIVANA